MEVNQPPTFSVRHWPTGLKIVKCSVLVPNVPGSNYGDSFTVPDFSAPTLHTECLGSQSFWKMKIMLGEHIRLTAFPGSQLAR